MIGGLRLEPASQRDAVRNMLQARTVAVVGSSGRPGSFGAQLLGEAMAGDPSLVVTPINPRYNEIAGLRCLPSLAALGEPVDLVLLGVPNAALEEQLVAAAAVGARSAVIYASGYAASDGSAIQAGQPALVGRLAAIAREADMAICGGNGMGFWSLDFGVRALGFKENTVAPLGPVTFLSASGSAFSALLRNRRQIGFNLVVSTGQEFVTTAADYLDYALDQPTTSVAAILLETAREPDRLRAALARAADLDIPVVALKVGRSARGSELVTAHSGALAGEDGAYEALFDAHGVIRVNDLDELCDTVELLVSKRRAGSGGLATIHDSGAERALTVDIADDLGVEFAQIGASTIARLGALLDPGLKPANPLDVWGTGADTRELFTDALRAMLADPAVGAVALAIDLVHEFDGDASYILAAIDAMATTDKPVAVLSHAHSSIDPGSARTLRAAGVPLLEGTTSGLRALNHLFQLRDRRARPPVRFPEVDPTRRDRWRGRLAGQALTASESLALVSEYGIACVPSKTADNPADVLAAAESIGYPVVLKTDDPAVPHKSDVGGVILAIATPAALAAAYAALSARLGPQVSVAAMAAPGTEISLGIVCDEQFGPLIIVAAGGTLIEVLSDRVVALPPLDAARSMALLNGLKVFDVLAGARGRPAVDLGSLCSAIVACSTMALELGDALAAIDINPILCHPSGLVAVDALCVANRSTG